MMGLEEHLIGMFRGDAEFHEDAAPSHLGGAVTPKTVVAAQPVPPETVVVPVEHVAANETLTPQEATWGLDAEKELRKIPFFVRGKAKRNTERFAIDRGVSLITVETLYDAKAHYGR
jgi:light-independent protochlorophyllide reductase subunit B